MTTLQIINCEIPTIGCFVNNIKKEAKGTILSLEAAQSQRNKSIVLGKIVSFTASDEGKVTSIIKEILPNCAYGQKFEAVIKEDLSKSFRMTEPKCGDRVGFFEPFIFPNPDLCDKNKADGRKRKQFILEIGMAKESIMWFSKKEPQVIHKHVLQQNLSEKLQNDLQKNNDSSKKQVLQENSLSSTLRSPIKILENHTNIHKLQVLQQNKNNHTPEKSSEVAQRNEKIQATKQSPEITKQNQDNQVQKVPKGQCSVPKEVFEEGVYKNIAGIKSDFTTNKKIRNKVFAVVHEIIKPLRTTKNGKFTMICNIIDKSCNCQRLEGMRLHFFTRSCDVISQIEQGDILCFHRICLEMFQGTVDGRVYSNNEVVLFKNTPQNITPIAKNDNCSLTDKDKSIVEELKKWYQEYLAQECKDVVSIESITQEGNYTIACKVVAAPSIEGQKLILKATDGSSTKHLASSTSLDKIDNIVTDIEVCGRQDTFILMKPEDFLLLHDVSAVHKGALRLLAGGKHYPQKLDLRSPKVEEIQRKLEIMAKEKHKVENGHRGNKVEEDNTKIVEENSAAGKKEIQMEKDKIVEEEDVTVLSVLNCSKNVSKNQNQDSSPTRERVNRKRSAKAPLFSPCTHKSCTKNLSEDFTQNEVNKDNESSPENCSGKRRKALFNANYGDLSDATDEASISQDPKNQSDVWLPDSVITPTNTSFDQLMKIVKAKYCSPRKISTGDMQANKVPTTQPTIKSNINGNHSIGKNENLENRVPVVKLIKLSDDCRNNGEIHNTIEEEASGGNTGKRAVKEPLEEAVEELLEDAATVVNLNTQDPEMPKRGKRVRLESESTVLGDLEKRDANLKDPLVNSISTDPHQTSKKVTTWLRHSGPLGDLDHEEMDDETVASSLVGRQDSPDLSCYITSMYKRLRVFLVRTIPDPASYPLDLVSGYCHSGCQQIYLFSTIQWTYNENDDPIPLCPSCYKLHLENELELMLMFQLQVMDTAGSHETLLVAREHAEEFLSCSVVEYLKDNEVRKSRIQLLADYTINNHEEKMVTPKMDITVVVQKNLLCVANSKLKLPLTM